LKSDGTVVATGQNDNGQLDVSDWTDIVAISTVSDAMTYRHTVGLKSDGSVVATGYRPNYEPLPIANWDLIDEAIGGGSDEDDNIGDRSELSLQLYSNRPSLNLAIGETIQLGVGAFDSGEQISDVSKIVYVIENPSLLRIASSGTRDDYRYASVVALNVGTTHIQISDANTGAAIRVPVTVSEPHGNTFTIYNVPKVNYERDYLTNFYNFNGMYVDSYTHSTNPDGSANISFDVYNTQIMFGVVEVYDEKGRIIDARVIDKMTGAPTSIKETLWDGMGYLIHDFGTGEIFTYKQQSGFSKRSEIEISNVPKGGYIRITNDPFYSTLCSIINGVDLMFEIKSVLSSASDFLDEWNAGTASQFTKEFTKNMLSDEIMVNLIQDSKKVGEKITKKIAEDAITDGKSLNNFFTSLGSALAELDVFKIIAKTGLNVGISAVESSLESFMGLAGTALNFIFIGGECLNFQMHFMNYARFALSGYIDIQVPSDNSVSSGGVTAESEDGFDNETALQVYNLYYDTDIADKFFKGDIPEELSELENTLFYEISLIKNGISVQPETPIKISVPIPLELRSFAGFIKIYRINADGTLTDMNAVVENGLLVFTTDHLSLYALTGISTPDAETDDPTEIEESTDTEESDDTDDSVETETPTETEESEDTKTPGITPTLPPSYNVPSSSTPAKSSSTPTDPSTPETETTAPRASTPELPFTDINKSDWFYADVEYAYKNGLMTGTDADKFSPNVKVSRAMLVTVLYRLSGTPPVSAAPDFTDVPAGQWYSDAVVWAAANGLVGGVGDNRFAPEDTITRQDMAVLFSRYASFAGKTLPAVKEAETFTDESEISDYAKQSVTDFNKAGLIGGVGGGRVNPRGEATRAEIAALLHRFIDAAGITV
jgi:hypothetical protein